ncbi:DUF262 domain-containing protein [Acinetobacter sp. B5B]|uniref:DUF262 domain-containing protein n=1 Tax=Acinetobacter baretiae TaxID=2605383 RepID=UPI0018C20474|nr:DUF262 domain-containing protein [Acinetobacter baretiae]MBF7682595.1 DUF262 domain-containing protein [Acinetobacter baretiae]
MDISPDKQNIDTLFASTQYNIDFYQRDYKWNHEPVKRLLDDFFYKFNEVYENHKQLPADVKVVDVHYPWYYLNTYVTNSIEGSVYVVDGQQRLTTITLILIKLFHALNSVQSVLSKWVENKICGHTGFEATYWMNHFQHINTIKDLHAGKIDTAQTNTGLTAENMVKNYKTISEWIDLNLEFEKNKIETFTFYFLRRLVLINLSVDQTDVPMVFEVINDRGVKLKPYEILKGKLLGQINKILLNKNNYNELWDSSLKKINIFSEDEADRFFRFYLKAKFADTRAEGQKYDGDYHRIIFAQDFKNKLDLDHNESEVIKFLDTSFRYYSQLYVKILKRLRDDTVSFFAFNSLNDLDGVLLLAMSVCDIDDVDEDNKVNSISKEVDRLFSLLQLQNIYESNAFQEMLFKISKKIRNMSQNSFRKEFDEAIKDTIDKRKQLQTPDVFSYALFKNTGDNLNTRFKRYFFARIEGFLAGKLKMGMKHSYVDLVLKTGSVNGFHVEHILSRNTESLSKFDNNEELFLIERNRLGGLLILKGKDNISSNNENYQDKLKTYSGTLIWNETLTENFYKSNLDLNQMNKDLNLELKAIYDFTKDSIEERQKILFSISKLIWD